MFVSGSHDSAGFALDVLDPRHLHLHGDPAALDTKDGHAILSTEEVMDLPRESFTHRQEGLLTLGSKR